MAAGAWTIYNRAKFYIGEGTIDLDGGTFRMALYTSASNSSTLTLSTLGSVTNEVAEANGYSSSGKPLTTVAWGTGASAKEYRWNADALIWTASGGTIPDVKFAVIATDGTSGNDSFVLCFSKLSTAEFTVSTGNTLTITPSSNGIFELN